MNAQHNVQVRTHVSANVNPHYMLINYKQVCSVTVMTMYT